jgi:hypothetical protein
VSEPDIAVPADGDFGWGLTPGATAPHADLEPAGEPPASDQSCDGDRKSGPPEEVVVVDDDVEKEKCERRPDEAAGRRAGD